MAAAIIEKDKQTSKEHVGHADRLHAKLLIHVEFSAEVTGRLKGNEWDFFFQNQFIVEVISQAKMPNNHTDLSNVKCV